MNRGGIRAGGLRASAGFVGASTGRAGMGDFWSDLTNPSTWNFNPTYSPVFQQTVVPALNVAGSAVGVALTGAPIPVGSMVSGLLNSAAPHAPTPAQPYNPGYQATPPIVAPPTANAGTPGTPAKDNTMLYLGLAGLAGFAVYLATRPAPHARAE